MARPHNRRADIEVVALQVDAGDAGMQVFALFQPRQNLADVLHGNGETDSRVVPFHAGHAAGGLRRKRHEDAHHAAANIDQWTAVIVGRDSGVGLQGLAPNPLDRTENPDGHVGLLALEGPPDRDRPLADAHLALRGDLAHRQRLVRVDLQQHDHPRVIAGHQLGRLASPVGQPHQDRRRLVDEVEGAGDDVTARIDRQSRRRAGSKKRAFDLLLAADGLDLHDRGRHAVDGGPEGGLLLGVGIVRAPHCRRMEQRRQQQAQEHPRSHAPRGNATARETRPRREWTQSVRAGVPTQSVGTRESVLTNHRLHGRSFFAGLTPRGGRRVICSNSSPRRSVSFTSSS